MIRARRNLACSMFGSQIRDWEQNKVGPITATHGTSATVSSVVCAIRHTYAAAQR
jgi:hypothetical protein